MNFIVDKGLTATATQAFDATDNAQDQRNATLARLMKAWESKNAKSAKRAGGFGFLAVTLAACGSSSDSDGDNGDGDNGGGENGGGTTPIPPALVEPDFFVLDFPTKTVNTMVFNVDGQPVSVEDALASFAQLADVTLPDGGSITIENLNVVQDAFADKDFDDDSTVNTINIGGAGSDQQLSFDEFLDLLQTQEVITVGRVILTPQDNSGIVFAPGFATGDQFEEGEFGTTGNPGSGDDVIFIGRTELLHAAIIDGGGGNDELVIVAKGNYAQPSVIRSIETVRILNSENTTVDVLADVEGKNILTEEDVNFQIVSTFTTFNSPTDADNTWIDLGASFGTTEVVIAENSGVTNSDLFVVGVNGGPTVVLQGGFDNNVGISQGLNFGGTVFSLRLEDVNFEGGNLLVGQNSTHLAFESTGSDATVENFINNGDFGGNVRQLTVTGDKFLHVNEDLSFNAGRTSTIDASGNTAGVKLSMRGDIGDGSGGAAQGINVQIIQDLSGSMGGQLADAQQAAIDTVNAFDAAGNARFQIVEFSDGATRTQWVSASDAIDQINNWTTGGGTDFDAGLESAIDGINDPGALPGAAFVTFPIGDGDVNVDTNSTPSVADWEAFLSANNGASYPIGIGSGVNLTDLADLGFNGITGDPIAPVDDSGLDLVTIVNQLVGQVIGGIGGMLEPTQQDIVFNGSAGPDDVTFFAEQSVVVNGGEGDNLYTLAARTIEVTGQSGDDTVVLRGFDESDASDRADAALVNLALGGGEDTVVLGLMGFGVTAREGSTIGGQSVTVIVGNTSDLSNAELSGVTSVVLDATLTVTSDQLSDLGAATFSTVDGAIGGTETLNVLVSGDAVLSDLIDPSELSSNMKLSFFIAEGASLTVSAEEVHKYLAEDAIDLGDGSNGTSPGNLIITNAGQNFDPFDSTFVDADGLPIVGGGTIEGATNNLTVERSDDGFNRPSQAPEDDTSVIDSSDGPVVVGPNGFGNDDEYTIPLTDTLIMQGENDITFTAPVSFDGQEGFTIDFSVVGGVVSGLEIVDFDDITPGTDPDDWGQVIGNGGARVDVQLAGNVATANDGLSSSGVATYVVTDLNGDDRQFWTSEPTQDVTTLGIQGNYGNGITFGNVIAGVDFLMEVTSDKFDPAYSVGELTVVFARDDVADAVVNIVGLQDLPAGEVQTVEGITLGAVNGNDAASATINVEGGDTVIEALTGDFPALTITGDADVTVEGDLPVTLTDIGTSGVVGVFTATINNPDEDFNFLGAEGGTVLTLDDVDGENIIDGGVGGAELIIEDTVDLSESTLSNISSVTLTDTSALTMTVGQALDIGMGNFSVEDGATTGTGTLTLNVTEDFDIDDLDVANLPDGLTLNLSLQSEVELNITGDQLVALEEAGVAITDGSGNDPEGAVNITDVNQTHMIDGSAVIPAALAGTVTLDGPIEIYVPSGTTSSFFDDFAWELEGGTLGLTEQSMADGLVVNNGDIQFFFVPSSSNANPTGDPIDASDYTAIGTVFVNEFGLPATYNIESITFLDSTTEVEIVPLVSPEFDGVDRTLIVGGVPFAIDDGTGAPFNPGTDDAGPVTTGVNLDFDNVSGDSNRNVETVTISFEEGGNIVGAITIGDGELPAAGNTFETLTLISNGDDVNTIEGDISAGASNNLLTVNIEANQDLVIGDDPVTPTTGTIILSSVDAGANATVTITGTEDVTLKGIDATDPDIATLTVDTSGYSGTYTVAGGSPSIDAGETLVFVGGTDSTVELDTADGPGDPTILGVDGNDDLLLLDASGMEGTLALGDVDNLAEGFTLTGGTGVITGNIIALPSDDWSLDISGSAADSALDLVLDGDAATLTAGSLALATDEDTGDTTLTFGDNTALLIEGPLDLSGFDNVVFGDNVELVLGEPSLVAMSDEQFADFDAAGGTITGETAKTFDAGIGLQNVRGLTEINIEEGADTTADPFTLSSDQVGIARIVDTDGVPVSDFGDIQAINTELSGDFAIVVKDGETFEVTDNEIDEVFITGDGAVIVTMEGTAGATLNVDTVATDDLPGQSITVNYTLDGVAGSVVLNNTATNFTSEPLVEAALAGSLDAVTGLNASPAGGIVTVEADEPGVEFVVTGVDVTGTNGMEIGDETFVNSTSDMSGNVVEDTTNVFPTLAAPAFYTVEGTLGGSEVFPSIPEYTVRIEGDNFIDLTAANYGPGLFPNVDAFVLTGGAGLEIKLNIGDLSDGAGGLTVTGDGSVQADIGAVVSGQDFSGIDVPLQLNVTAGPAGLVGATLFNPDQPLTLVDTSGALAPGPVFNISNITGANNVPSLNRPSEVELDNVDFTLTAAQADGLVVTGASEVTVELDGTSTNPDLSGMDVPVEIENTSGADTDFGGALPSGQPITFSGGNIISLNGNTIPAGAVVSIAAGTTLDVTGGTLGAGVSFIMEDAISVLTITGAQADGTVIEGAPDPITGDPQPNGTVNLIDLDGTEDLSGIDGPTLALVFADDADAGSIAASAVDGRTITIEGGDPAEDFTLTVTGLEDVPGADLSGLTLNLATGGNSDVVVELDSTGDVTMADTANLSLGGTVSSLTLTVSGTGTVDVADGANLSAVTAFEVGADATLVSDSSLTANSVIDPADVSGDGTLEVTGFAAGDPIDSENGGIAQQVFVFGDDDFQAGDEVQIGFGPFGTEFDNTNGDGVNDALDLNAILDVQDVQTSVNVGGFGTGNDGQVLNLFADVAADVNDPNVIVTAFEGAGAGNTVLGSAAGGEENFLVVFDDALLPGPSAVWLWEDGVDADGGGTNVAADGIVGQSELTQVAFLVTNDDQPLSDDNFIV